MEKFSAKYGSSIKGALSGFDRLVFRGTLRGLCYLEGMKSYLSSQHVLLKEFGSHAESITERIKAASLAPVQALGRPVEYLASAKTSKEEVARRIAREDGIMEGPICVLTSVEPCHSYEVYRNREAKRLQLVSRYRKCLHLYHYAIHPTFGFMSARLQTWFPLSIQICINGREWLARQMDREGLGYVRQGNCFVALEDFERAQALMDEQLKVNWADLLEEIATTLNPIHDELFGQMFGGAGCRYYWSTHQSEWATDLVFGEAETLRRLHCFAVHSC